MLASLTVLRDTGLKLTGTTGDDEDSAVGLRGTSNHVLDEVTVSGGVDDLADDGKWQGQLNPVAKYIL